MVDTTPETNLERRIKAAADYIEEATRGSTSGRWASLLAQGALEAADKVDDRLKPSAAVLKNLTFNVYWSREDHQWVGTCDQIPSLAYMDVSYAGADKGIRCLAEEQGPDILEYLNS